MDASYASEVADTCDKLRSATDRLAGNPTDTATLNRANRLIDQLCRGAKSRLNHTTNPS